MPANKIVVETRRDGGSYGGKFIASRRITGLTAAVSRILARPARCVLLTIPSASGGLQGVSKFKRS